MPAIRDGRGKLIVIENEPPPAVPPGPIERTQASAQRMADFAAERQRTPEAIRRDRALLTESRVRGNAASVATRREAHRLTALQERQRLVLTSHQAQVIEALRRLGSREAVRREIGARFIQNIDTALIVIWRKHLLPADLPDLPRRLQRAIAAERIAS